MSLSQRLVEFVSACFTGLWIQSHEHEDALFGSFLSWLNDHDSDVFVVCTANDVAKRPPEFGRAERFDAIFFLDFPGREQKQAIGNLYRELFEIDRDQKLPADDQWSGAEIRACSRLAALLDVPLMQAAQNVVPVAVTAAESVDRLRTWASGRCLDADRGGIYQGNGAKSTARRKVSRNPLSNGRRRRAGAGAAERRPCSANCVWARSVVETPRRSFVS